MSGESFGVDFVAGEQEQERHAELVQEFHGVVYFDYAQSVRAECAPAASSSTVCGMNLPGISCATIGLTAATAMMIVNETSSCVMFPA